MGGSALVNGRHVPDLGMHALRGHVEQAVVAATVQADVFRVR
jgi:hypothetical protein